ncbi:uracil phosphoribosyltransferase [Aeromicrobium sp.]|uniref:uracil phosphoribosyltransferase n=1 Tax=Aeromicrobium sp. TaxID=1871063 RepID=UPI0019A0E87A|nr:uracil phosphoribosyltransferase [Aeromicrobium sp.]MBC7631519.1 uracil phosphoribosyltransferase [Aeromicrobium sp.]
MPSPSHVSAGGTVLSPPPTAGDSGFVVSQKLHVLPATPALLAAHTLIRDRDASREVFTTQSRRVFRMLLETAVGLLPSEPKEVLTPAGHVFTGLVLTENVCAVSVVRAGESLESELWAVVPGVRVGKILIQRDKSTAQPRLYYSHLPPNMEHQHVLLLEPMLATGGSLLAALDVLASAGTPSSRVIAVNLLSSPPGLARVMEEHPDLTVVTSSVEQELDDNAFMVPGIGDFGDRYFGTDGGGS